MLNPNNIKGKTFDTEKNGYSKEDVKEFLGQVAEDYAEVVKANQDTEAKIIKLVEKINEDIYDAIILNFANCDMVGHTGVFDAAVKAVEAVDTCVGKVVDAIKEMGGVALITADHGNADKMVAEDGSPFTAHTTNPVPFCVVNYDCELREGGRLADIAPTMLQIMGLEQPEEMDGTSLIK